MIVTCAALAAAVSAAAPGDTIQLAAGSDCPGISLKSRDWSSDPVTLVLDDAILRGLHLDKITGLRVRGGNIRAPGGRVPSTPGRALNVIWSRDVQVDNVRVDDADKGMVIIDSTQIGLANSELTGLKVDGVIIVRSSHVRIEGNRLHDFSPTPSRCTYTDGSVTEQISKSSCEAGGGVWKDGDHPDGVQMWDSVTDVQLLNNSVLGNMQGLARLGTAGSGIARIVVEGNLVNISYSHGITFTECMDCRIVGNEVRSNGEGQFSTIIRYSGSTGVFCGNIVPQMKASDPVRQPCPS